MNVPVETLFFSLDTTPSLHSLSPDERDRASRFRFDTHRNRYIVSRATLRATLGKNLNTDPAALQFTYGPQGKPLLPNIHFNVSHSHDQGMIVVADTEVGCDVERIDPKFSDEQIPERFFSPSEVAALRALPKQDQQAAFFRIWTRKEAYIKACGLGVSIGLDTFDVSVTEDAKLLSGDPQWEFYPIDAPAGCAAAIVIRNRSW